jgi:hypothetical protein
MGHTGAARQQLSHDSARGAHAGLRQDFGIAWVCAFRNSPCGQFALPVCQIGVALFP